MLSYKTFEHLSHIWMQNRKDNGFHIVGYNAATKLWKHIGKQVNIDGSHTGKLIDIEPVQRGRIIKYYGIIEIQRGAKTFTSKRLVSQIKPV